MIIKRLFLCLLCLMLAAAPVCACAADSLEEHFYETLACLQGDYSLQAYVDGPVTEAVGSSMDDFIICLNHFSHEIDLSKYADAAEEKLKQNAISNPVTRQRCALTLVSCGMRDHVPGGIVDESAGKLGVMSYVYALHLINNGVESSLWTMESLLEKLYSLQKQDGGWAVLGNYGDPDVTAMCLQALSAAGVSFEDEAVQRAVTFLSENQLENGNFKTFSDENAESAAQVIIALSSYGIDPSGDERFIKNGNSPFDALMRFKLPEGGYSHIMDGDSSDSAALQALQAFAALKAFGTPYYDSTAEPVGSLDCDAPSGLPVWKLCAFSVIGAVCLIGCIVALRKKHGRMKRILFVLILSLAAAAAVWMINIESTDEYYQPAENTAADGEVYISIFCDTVAGADQSEELPEDGVILERSAVPFTDGDSVFDVLTKAARTFEIHMEHEGGTGEMAYVNGIHYLYEFVHGDLSGWMYEVNGESPSIGGGAYKVQAGDEIIWRYTTELGEDLK